MFLHFETLQKRGTITTGVGISYICGVSSVRKLCRQHGHSSFFANHSAMHSRWNTWWQSRLHAWTTSSPSWYGPRQIAHTPPCFCILSSSSSSEPSAWHVRTLVSTLQTFSSGSGSTICWASRSMGIVLSSIFSGNESVHTFDWQQKQWWFRLFDGLKKSWSVANSYLGHQTAFNLLDFRYLLLLHNSFSGLNCGERKSKKWWASTPSRCYLQTMDLRSLARIRQAITTAKATIANTTKNAPTTIKPNINSSWPSLPCDGDDESLLFSDMMALTGSEWCWVIRLQDAVEFSCAR